MAIISQKSLFVWTDEINALGDLERLLLVLEQLPDEALMQKLEARRGKGRNDYPIRAMWNLLVAGMVFGHTSDASLLRELRRNRQLVYVCGFEHGKIPDAPNLTRFRSLLLGHQNLIDGMFETLSDILYGLEAEYGKELAIDSKWIESAANRESKLRKKDGRSEGDARKGIKTYSGIREDGSTWRKTDSCFGFKLHLLVDAKYELPVAYELTDAAASDIVQGRKLFNNLKKKRPTVLRRGRHIMADKGYDDTSFIEMMKEEEIRAVIDKRNMRKGDPERVVPGYQDAYYDEAGNVYCYGLDGGKKRTMVANGYESGRDALRFKCPAMAYGATCVDIDSCRCKHVRVPLSIDPRVFTQVQRESYKWKRLYRMRTAVERVNSRIDMVYGFESHRARGLGRVRLRVSLALSVMLAVAVARYMLNQPELMRRLLLIS